jgi:hypothetical protein
MGQFSPWMNGGLSQSFSVIHAILFLEFEIAIGSFCRSCKQALVAAATKKKRVMFFFYFIFSSQSVTQQILLVKPIRFHINNV